MSNLYPDESISAEKCWERLHANTLGRLILTDGQHVDVLPVLHWLPPEMTPQIVRTFDLPDSDTHEMQWVRIAPQTVYGREYPLLPAYLDGTQPDSDTLTR